MIPTYESCILKKAWAHMLQLLRNKIVN
jgi:hypothetical protein